MKSSIMKLKFNRKEDEEKKRVQSEYKSKIIKPKEKKKTNIKSSPNQKSAETQRPAGLSKAPQVKEKYPSSNISQDQLKRTLTLLKKCGTCNEGNISQDYYKSLLISYLELITRCFEENIFPVDASSVITLPIFSDICHKVAEILSSEPTLLTINSEVPKETFLVLSDLHGCFEVLMFNFYHYHCLPKKKIIILGDYVDKGPDDAFICLFLFLCKIVWPDKLFLLKGNHEIRDMNRQKDFPDNCEHLLGDKSTFYMFNFVFERMPIAAIWNNNVYLAHGGISQWMTCREDIVNIKRPLKLNRTIKSRLLITDILWSDPYRKCYKTKEDFNKFFAVSKRGCGFAYSQEGLEAIMKCLNVNMIVRGHQTSKEGFVEEYKNRCYTIHSKPSSRENAFGSSCLLTLDDNGNVLLRPLKYKLPMDRSTFLSALGKLKSLWKSSKFSEFPFKKSCQYCGDKDNYVNELACMERILVTHAQLTMWLTSRKIQMMIELEFGKKVGKKWKNPEKLLSRFPVYFDFCISPLIGQSVRMNNVIEKKERDLAITILKKMEKVEDKNILIGDPNLTIDNLAFLRLNAVEGNKRKRFEYTSDDEYRTSGSDMSSGENDDSEDGDDN
uniref:Serine/threonine-protein phosphatase n=1 Tax=Strongyloides papillosus TaxID=174720 RepID=A0A0N5BFU3_STREA